MGHVSKSLLSIGTAPGPDLCKYCVCGLSLCELKCASVLLCLEVLVSRCPPSPLVPTVFLPLFPQGPLSPEGEGFARDILFRTECPKSLAQHVVCLWVASTNNDASLVVTESDTVLGAQQNVARSHFIAAFY